MKVTVVGAGNVGATCANCIAEKDIVNEVVLLDIKEGVAEGKSLDMWQTAPRGARRPLPSATRPTTLVTLPYNFMGLPACKSRLQDWGSSFMVFPCSGSCFKNGSGTAPPLSPQHCYA